MLFSGNCPNAKNLEWETINMQNQCNDVSFSIEIAGYGRRRVKAAPEPEHSEEFKQEEIEYI